MFLIIWIALFVVSLIIGNICIRVFSKFLTMRDDCREMLTFLGVMILIMTMIGAFNAGMQDWHRPFTSQRVGDTSNNE